MGYYVTKFRYYNRFKYPLLVDLLDIFTSVVEVVEDVTEGFNHSWRCSTIIIHIYK